MTCSRCLSEGRTFHLIAPVKHVCPICYNRLMSAKRRAERLRQSRLLASQKAERRREATRVRVARFRGRRIEEARVNPIEPGHNWHVTPPLNHASTGEIP
jgi:hypothetical protein